MQAELHMTLPDTTRLALTEAALASADRLWREEMRRTYGPDGVLADECSDLLSRFFRMRRQQQRDARSAERDSSD